MADKYNLKDELLKKDEELNGSLSVLGMSALTMPNYINSMRTVMFTSHLKQFVNLKNPEFPGVFTNAENLVGEHSDSYTKAKKNYEVFKKVVKYGTTKTPLYYLLFLYDSKRDKYTVVERKPCENLTELFGYEYNNEEIDSYEEGDFIEKGTVLSKSTSFDNDMNYGYGLNVPTMMSLEPLTSEDAAVVSMSLAKKMLSTEVETITIGLNDNEYMKNLFGNENVYQTIPHIGQYCDGILAAKMSLFKNQILHDFKDSNLSKPNYTSDTIYYGKGQVIDIDIYCNNPEIERNMFNEQILDYLDMQTAYYEAVHEICSDIMESGSKYTHDIEYLYRRSGDFINTEYKWKEGDKSFSNLMIDITIKRDVPLYVGQKLTGRFGNKSVVSCIRPDEEMPFIKMPDGTIKRVDLILNLLAIINRTITAPLFEMSLNFIGEHFRRKIAEATSLKEKENLLFGILEMVNEVQCKNEKAVYSSLSKTEKEEYMNAIVNDRIYFHQKPMWEEEPIFYRLMKIYNKYDFLHPYQLYVNKWGREIPVQNKQFIGDMYILKLKQSSKKGFSVRSTGSINSKGLPSRSYKVKEHQELHSAKPIRFGEFETLKVRGHYIAIYNAIAMLIDGELLVA